MCKALERDTLNDPEVLKRLAQLVPVKLNVDQPAGSMQGKQLGLDGVPAIMFAKPSGEIVHGFKGMATVQEFLMHLDSAEAVFAGGKGTGSGTAPGG